MAKSVLSQPAEKYLYFAFILNCCSFWVSNSIFVSYLINWRYYLGFWFSLLGLQVNVNWLLSAFEILCLLPPQFFLSCFLSFSWSFFLYYPFIIFSTFFYISLKEVFEGFILLLFLSLFCFKKNFFFISTGFYFWCLISLDVLWFLSITPISWNCGNVLRPRKKMDSLRDYLLLLLPGAWLLHNTTQKPCERNPQPT